MSLSAQFTSEQLKVIIEDEMNTDKGASEDQKQVEDGEVVLNPENKSSVLNTVLNTINNQFEHQCLDETLRQLNVHCIYPSADDHVPIHKYSIPGLHGNRFLEQQVSAIWFNVRR